MLIVKTLGTHCLLLVLGVTLGLTALRPAVAANTSVVGGPVALELVYNKQNPRWEAPGRGSHKPATKPYKPQRLPPENLPTHRHAPRGSRALNRFAVLALTGVVLIALAAQWLAAKVRLAPAWIALLGGLVLGPVTGLLDPAVLFGKAWLPLVAMVFAVVVFEDLLRARADGLTGRGRLIARMLAIEAVIVGVAAAIVATFEGLDPVAAALLFGLLLITQSAAPREMGTDSATLLEGEGRCLEVGGVILAFVACAVSLAVTLHRDAAPAAMDMATVVLGGSLGGVILGYGLIQLLGRAKVAQHGRPPLLLAVVLAAFALPNLVAEGSGFFVVLALGLYFANQKQMDLLPGTARPTVSPALTTGLLALVAAGARLDAMTTLETAGLAALVALLCAARLLAGRVGGPWHARLALTGDASTTAVAVAATAVCAARLDEFGVLPGSLVVTLVVLVTFIRLSVAGLAGAFATRRWGAAPAPTSVPERAKPTVS